MLKEHGRFWINCDPSSLSLFSTFFHESSLLHIPLSNIPSFHPLLGSFVKIRSLKVRLSEKYFCFIRGQHFQLKKAQEWTLEDEDDFVLQWSGRHFAGFSQCVGIPLSCSTF